MENYKNAPVESMSANELRFQLLAGRVIYCRVRFNANGAEEDVCLFWDPHKHGITMDHLPEHGYQLSTYYEEELPFTILYENKWQ